MTTNSRTLAKSFGDKNTAAMVLLMAYANFQDRLLNCLGARSRRGTDDAGRGRVQARGSVGSDEPGRTSVIPPFPGATGKDLIGRRPANGRV